MNEKGVNALVAAALRGVRQIKHKYRDDEGGLCGLGVLEEAIGARGHPLLVMDVYDLAGRVTACQHGCRWRSQEYQLLVHLNDVHNYDFLALARKLGPPDA